MTFLAPAILGGAAAIGLPILIHLLNKTQVKVMRWAAMRFLLQSVQKNESRIRVEDLILLLLRCLLFLLLALAFARPAFESILPLGSFSGEPRTAMLVLDHSASMGYNDGRQTRLQAAKTEAIEILDKWPAGSVCGLILAGETPDFVVPQPSRDLTLVRRRIELTSLEGTKSNLAPAILAAAEALRSGGGLRQEIHIFTDDSSSAWRDLEEIRSLRAKYPDIAFIHHPQGNRESDNFGLTDLRTEISIPAVGEPVSILATLKNWGPSPVSQIRITASIDSKAPLAEQLIESLAPGEELIVPLSVKFLSPGFHSVTVESPADRLPADNVRSLALAVSTQVKVLLVEDASTGPSTSFFLSNALAPVSEDRRESHYVQTSIKTPQQAESLNLAEFSAIVLSSPSAGSSLGSRLNDFVKSGGSLVVFPGEQPAVSVPETIAKLLPGRFERAEVPAKGIAGFSLKAADHPVTGLWSGQSGKSFDSVTVARRYPLELPGTDSVPAVQVILAYTDGKPAMAEWSQGHGHVVVVGFPLRPGWTNLYLHPDFVPLAQRLLSYIVSIASEGINLPPGRGFIRETPVDLVGQQFSVKAPGEIDARPAGQVEARESSGSIVFSDTNESGAYEVYLNGQEHPYVVFSVQSQRDAGELRYADQISELFEEKRAPTEASLTPAKEKQPSKKHELWWLLIGLVTALSLTELFLAHRFSQSR